MPEHRHTLSTLNLNNVNKAHSTSLHPFEYETIKYFAKIKTEFMTPFTVCSIKFTSPNKNGETILLLLPTFYELTCIFNIYLAI